MNLDSNNQKEEDNKSVVRVFIEKGDSAKKEYFFKDTFRIGRENCAVKINDGLVSREHLEISYQKGEWLIGDLLSTNGTYIDGKRIDHLLLTEPIKLELGENGPIVQLDLVSESDSRSAAHSEIQGSLTSIIKRYFSEEADNPNVGKHTSMIQEAFKVVKKKQSKKYLNIIIVVVIVAIAAVAYSIYQHIRVNELKKQAENNFYDMKEFELSINNIIDSLDISKERSKELQKKLKDREEKYNSLIENLDVYSDDEEVRLIQKTARAFGECEINMPEEFIDTVKKFIGYWQRTSKLKNALKRAEENNYTQSTIYHLYRLGLPLQFFYLPIQESEFIDRAVGPPTYAGYAKGIWMFISATAEAYGLKVGPLKDTNLYDPVDERFDFYKATPAATDYIKDIYSTEAQASGLLVMASYNWGPRVVKYIKMLSRNPRDRNFWNLLSFYGDKVPKETYNYVFYIFSAAVIGENPKLFGFKFDNPIAKAVEELDLNNLN